MDFLALRFAVYNAAHTLTHGFTYKSVIGAILAVLLHKHAVLFMVFTALVFLDCFTRWMSLSYKRLQGMGQTPSVMQIIGGIEAARAEGLISSEVMKHRFVGKVIVHPLRACRCAGRFGHDHAVSACVGCPAGGRLSGHHRAAVYLREPQRRWY